MRAVIFDLDGTLADTSADLLAAANAAFDLAGHGAPLNAGDALTAFHGGRAMLRLGAERLGLGWDENEVGRHYPVLLDAYEGAIDTHTRLYPGAAEAVEGLRTEGIAVGICTNKPDHLAEKLLVRLGVRDMFAAMVGANTLPVRKPDPAPLVHAIAGVGGDAARAVLIGDTETDRKTGRAAGVPVVLVTFGPEGEGVSRLAPDALLHAYPGLRATIAPFIDRS
ncbi:MAG: HAD-IA family hydrolase [Rhodobacterales bacterium]|nr:HAD-IA family hydrolase [Rhodobacterales bacterium]MDX5500076.1 HAD-IA family hydrolase [Rhodobacterales bacterium]